jgi:hypothetical protein
MPTIKTVFALAVLLAGCGGDKDKTPDKAEKVEKAEKPERVERASVVDEALQAKRTAEQARDDAVKAAAEAQEQLDRVQQDLHEMDKRVSAAMDAVVAAQNDADRAAAQAELKALRSEKAEMDARISAARAEAARAQRKKGVGISKACMDNPLAKGCQ